MLPLLGDRPRRCRPRKIQFGVAQAAEALRWWIDAGVNFALDETPHNRFAEESSAGEPQVAREAITASRKATTPGVRSNPMPGGGTIAPGAAETAARALAAGAKDLDALRAVMTEFDGCALKRTATQLVFADGAPGSPVMFVGEAPGRDEDQIGRPFVGRAGQLLDRMLNAIGLDRRQVYIANVVPWRPPGNRTPTVQETQVCLPFIRRQIELAAPEILVCLGGSAVQTLLGVAGGITRARGSWFTYPCESGRGFGRWRCCIPPIRFVSRRRSASPGPICERSPAP